MSSSEAPSASPITPRENCEICQGLPSSSSYDVFHDNASYKADFSRLESFEDVLEARALGGLKRCPICHTFYLETGESDPHHFMSYEMSISRIEDGEAVNMLATMMAARDYKPFDVDKAKLWMGTHDVDSHVAELNCKLDTAEATEAATSLAEIYFRQKEWGELEALLRHENSDVRGGALDTLEGSVDRTSPEVIKAVVTLLEDQAHSRKAHDVFNCTSFEKVSPLITTFADCLDHKNAKVRAMAVDSINHHLEADSGYYIGEDGKGTYGPPKHPKLDAKIAKKLSSCLPQLISHLIKPRSAPWGKIDANPRSEEVRGALRKMTTGIGASRILNAMIHKDAASKASVRKALEAVGPNLQKIYTSMDIVDLDSDVYYLATEVTPRTEF